MRAVCEQVSFKTTASISDSAISYAMASSPVAGLPAAPPVLAREMSAPARLICDMGFPVAWAEFALVAVGGEDVTAAIDYCLANADKMEELIATPSASGSSRPASSAPPSWHDQAARQMSLSLSLPVCVYVLYMCLLFIAFCSSVAFFFFIKQ